MRTSAKYHSTPGDCRNNAHFVIRADRGAEVLEIADVLVIDIDIDESAKFVAIEKSLAKRRVPGAELVEKLSDCGAEHDDPIETLGMGSHRGGDADDWHVWLL
jgi:hypothetical protein